MSSLAAMPLVVVNLGGEMMYVLRQRLIAQKIDPAKAKQVLNEVIGAMFNTNFIDELFKPHELYTFEATKHIFERLAHCSIMKLNATSMSKLYDLMTMVFKFQLLNCRSPRDIIGVTLRHIDNLRTYVEPRVQDLLDRCASKIDGIYGSYSIGQFWSLKQTLFDFVQGRNVKVSLLLQEKFQGQDGRMVLSLNGPCPDETPVPGMVRHFDAEANVYEEYEISLSLTDHAQPQDYDEAAYEKVHSLLGANLYAIYRGEASTSPSESKEEEEAATQKEDRSSLEAKSQRASEELNILAQLIVPTGIGSSSTEPRKTFRLNLFGSSANDSMNFNDDEDDYDDVTDLYGAPKEEKEQVSVNFDAKAQYKTMQQRMDELDLDDHNVETGASKEADIDDDDIDLLDLMDQAAASASSHHK